MKSLPPAPQPSLNNKAKQELWSRRSNLKALGLLPIIGSGLLSARQVKAADLACTLAPEMTQGPYWVDEKLNRADITTGTTRSSVQNGKAMSLDILLYDNNGQLCGNNPAQNVRVDIWHCDASGEYSDASGGGQANTLGQDFLRGYQVSNSAGKVSFTTIYPGWYNGRATHIHLRARVYDSVGNTTYNFVTQLFFDDTFTDQVYTTAPYNLRSIRNTRNSNDMIYRSANTPPLVTAGSTTVINGPAVYAQVAIGLSGLPASTLFRDFAVTVRNEGSASVPDLIAELVIASSDVGSTGNIYVAADVGSKWYFSNGSTWVLIQNPLAQGFPAFWHGTLSTAHSFSFLYGINTGNLGKVNFFVGYGVDNLDMLQNQRYRYVHTLNG